MSTDNPQGLVVYGDIGMDLHIRTSSRPESGQDAQVESVRFEPGGSAANCAAVAAGLGVPTEFIGFTGTDAFGETLRDDLAVHGVSVDRLQTIEGTTGVTTAIIEPGGERTFYSYRGVNAAGELAGLPDDLFENKRFLHLSGYSFQEAQSRENALYLMEKARIHGVQVSLDPSFWFSKTYKDEHQGQLAGVSIIFPSREEAQLISGSYDPEGAAQAIRGMGPETVIVTLGAQGCYVASDEYSGYLPAAPVTEVVDTTGAGDAFCGGYLAGCVTGLNTLDAARAGNWAASNIIRQAGGRRGAPSLDGLREYLQKS
ncbi:MAG: carbohydrate kinase family protein [Anaerolineales bacterium]|nr:carbohydrate kinase family protein [Anaerolineales bacterium]